MPDTHIVAVVAYPPPRSFSEHQQVHLRLHRAGAAQGLPAPIVGLSWVGVPEGHMQGKTLIIEMQMAVTS